MFGVVAPLEVFCSYSHEDEAWLKKLGKHLSQLKHDGLISFWYDRQLVPGTDWAQHIDEHLNSAAIILLLISSDFLSSEYCYGIEMTRALERHHAGQARVIPILLHPCDWESAPFASLQALPTPAEYISDTAYWHTEDFALRNVAQGIRAVAKELRERQQEIIRRSLLGIDQVPSQDLVDQYLPGSAQAPAPQTQQPDTFPSLDWTKLSEDAKKFLSGGSEPQQTIPQLAMSSDVPENPNTKLFEGFDMIISGDPEPPQSSAPPPASPSKRFGHYKPAASIAPEPQPPGEPSVADMFLNARCPHCGARVNSLSHYCSHCRQIF